MPTASTTCDRMSEWSHAYGSTHSSQRCEPIPSTAGPWSAFPFHQPIGGSRATGTHLYGFARINVRQIASIHSGKFTEYNH